MPSVNMLNLPVDAERSRTFPAQPRRNAAFLSTSISQCTMAARPPPARPHIALNPSNRFNSFNTDWIEDDAWDSASDSESAGNSLWKSGSSSHHLSSSSTSPKPVPRNQNNSSSSTLASSYTHLNAPSPSSYPPKPEVHPPKSGWINVKRKGDHHRGEHSSKASESHGDVEVEGDMILGELEPEVAEHQQSTASSTKPRHDHGSLRDDIDDIINGIHGTLNHLSPLPHAPARSVTPCASEAEANTSFLTSIPKSAWKFGEAQPGAFNTIEQTAEIYGLYNSGGR